MFVAIFNILGFFGNFLHYSEKYMLEFNILSINLAFRVKSFMVSTGGFKFALFFKGFAFLCSFHFLLMSPVVRVINVLLVLEIVGYDSGPLVSIDIP